nr:hypothetical protein [uncultured Allomuricauda sp.]
MCPTFRIFFLFFIAVSFLHAQDSFEKGIVHDSILVAGAEKETFALYLPKSFNENQLSSIVFIFEPAARGAIGIQPFITVSEKYGHILVCSNNSRNGPYNRNFEIANRLFKYIFSRFSINESEMYLSGFSGGSRLASAIASLTDKFAGVVGCGAGFSYIQEQMPAAQAYSYVGLCGDRDMNFREMQENKDYLKLIKFNSTLITYDDEHRWPPQNQILRAFDWLHLQKLKKETSASDKILSQYHADYTLFKQFMEDQKLLLASEQSERMLKDYKHLLETDSLSKQHAKLLRSKVYKKQKTALSNALKREIKLADRLRPKLSNDFENPNDVDFDWWKKEFEKLNELIEKDDSDEIRKMAYRVRFDLFAKIYSRRNSSVYDQNPELSELINQFLGMLRASSK